MPISVSSYSFERSRLSQAFEALRFSDTGKNMLNVVCARPKLGIFDAVKAAGVGFFSFLATSMYIKPSIELARLYSFIPSNILQWPYILSSVSLNTFVNSYFGKVAIDSVILPMFKDIFNVLRLNIIWRSCGAALKNITKWFFSHVIEIGIAVLTAYPFYAVDRGEHARDYYGDLFTFLKPLTEHTDIIVLAVSALLFLCGVRDCISNIYNLYQRYKKPDEMAVKQVLVARFNAILDDFLLSARKGDDRYHKIVNQVNELPDFNPDNQKILNAQNISILYGLCEAAPEPTQSSGWKLAITRIAFVLGMEISLLGYFFGCIDAIKQTLKISAGGAIVPSIGVFAPLAWLAGEVADSVAQSVCRWMATKELILPLSFAHSAKAMKVLSAASLLPGLFSAATSFYLNETTPWLKGWRDANYWSFFAVIQVPSVLMTALFNVLPFVKVAARTERALRLPVNKKTSEEKRKEIYFVNYLESLINTIQSADPKNIMQMLYIISTIQNLTPDEKSKVFDLLLGVNKPKDIFAQNSLLHNDADMLSAITTYYQHHQDEEQGVSLLSGGRFGEGATGASEPMSINGRRSTVANSYGTTFNGGWRSYAGRDYASESVGLSNSAL